MRFMTVALRLSVWNCSMIDRKYLPFMPARVGMAGAPPLASPPRYPEDRPGGRGAGVFAAVDGATDSRPVPPASAAQQNTRRENALGMCFLLHIHCLLRYQYRNGPSL